MFNFRELEVIEKVYNSNKILKAYTSMIQFKKSMYYVKEKCGIDVLNDILGVKDERETYKVVQYESSLPFDGEFELYTGLNKRSAYNIARRLSDKMYKYECENECDTGIQYLVIYTNEYGESISIDYTVGMWKEY